MGDHRGCFLAEGSLSSGAYFVNDGRLGGVGVNGLERLRPGGRPCFTFMDQIDGLNGPPRPIKHLHGLSEHVRELVLVEPMQKLISIMVRSGYLRDREPARVKVNGRRPRGEKQSAGWNIISNPFVCVSRINIDRIPSLLDGIFERQYISGDRRKEKY